MSKVQYSGGFGGLTDMREIDQESFRRLNIHHDTVTWLGKEPQEMDDAAANALVEALPLEFSILTDGEAEDELDAIELDEDDDTAKQPGLEFPLGSTGAIGSTGSTAGSTGSSTGTTGTR